MSITGNWSRSARHVAETALVEMKAATGKGLALTSTIAELRT
jgi:hypothetical protein